jgi:tight adherence protein C
VLLPILIFLVVSLGLAGLYLWWVPTTAQRRVRRLSQTGGPAHGHRPSMAAQTPDWSARIARLAAPLARWSAPARAWENSPLRLQFLQAGIARDDARLIYFAAKTVLPLLICTALFFSLQARVEPLKLLLCLCLAALCASYAPNLVVQAMGRRRRREIFEAGLGMDAAFNRVALEMKLSSADLAQELQTTNLELRAGVSRDQALRNLALRCGVEEIASFALMLKQADRFGTSMGDSLRVYSDELRHKRMVRAEELAARVPTKMLLPLVLCIFPSVILVILGPAVIQVVRTLAPMLGGGS